MSAVRQVYGLVMNFLGLVTTVVTSAATTTTITAVATGGILTVCRNGIKATLSAGAKAYAQYLGTGVADSTVRTLVATSTTGQAAVVVHCMKNVSGTETLVQVLGPTVDLDVSGSIVQGSMKFPTISDDTMIPVAYTVVVNPAASSTATFTFGTSNWNATSIVTSNAKDIAALPKRAVLATTTSTL